MPESPPAAFDAEKGPDMARALFQNVEVQRWDGPLMQLHDTEALLLWLRGRGVSDDDARRAAAKVSLPLTLTKRGAIIFGYKRG